jgi:hypothetical protein
MFVCRYLQSLLVVPYCVTGGDHSLSASQVAEQANASLKNLGLDCVDLFYLHAPDLSTPIEETLKAVNDLHQQVCCFPFLVLLLLFFYLFFFFFVFLF